jgi:hypothetical protein
VSELGSEGAREWASEGAREWVSEGARERASRLAGKSEPEGQKARERDWGGTKS